MLEDDLKHLRVVDSYVRQVPFGEASIIVRFSEWYQLYDKLINAVKKAYDSDRGIHAHLEINVRITCANSKCSWKCSVAELSKGSVTEIGGGFHNALKWPAGHRKCPYCGEKRIRVTYNYNPRAVKRVVRITLISFIVLGTALPLLGRLAGLVASEHVLLLLVLGTGIGLALGIMFIPLARNFAKSRIKRHNRKRVER